MRLMDKEIFRVFCHEQGMAFIRNFELYYDDPIANENSWKELHSIYKSIMETRILGKESNHIDALHLIDWFFKADYDLESVMKQPSYRKRKTYGDFVINLLYGEKMEEAFNHAIKKNITE